MTISDLPWINACWNACSTVLLLAGWGLIRRGRREAHRNCMLGALASSSLFLAGYLTYHAMVPGVTRFLEPAWFRPIYLTLLLSHTLLAAALLPLVVVTLTLALRGRWDRHRRWARWTWPVWVYVSVTGVAIYLLLYQVFPQGGGGATTAGL